MNEQMETSREHQKVVQNSRSHPINLIPVAEPAIVGNELDYITECIQTRWISSLGRFVNDFERAFAERYGMPYALTTCNGTAALHLALLAAGIGAGDEVIVPALTFVATANAVAYTGATPVFVDVDPVYWNMNPELIEGKITERTCAIIPVHLFGQAADMKSIQAIAEKHHLMVIEDTAEAQEAHFDGRYVGSFGDISTFSFYGNKLMTTGEGGMVLLRDEKLYKQAKLLRDHAMSPDKRYYHPQIGYNYRMTNMQAALGLAQLEKIDEIRERKLAIAMRYLKGLQGVEVLTVPTEFPNSQHVFWMFSVVINKGSSMTRDVFMEALKARMVDSRPFFHPIPDMPAFMEAEISSRYPVATHLGSNGVSLPSSILLKDEEIDYICESIRTILHPF